MEIWVWALLAFAGLIAGSGKTQLFDRLVTLLTVAGPVCLLF